MEIKCFHYYLFCFHEKSQEDGTRAELRGTTVKYQKIRFHPYSISMSRFLSLISVFDNC